MTISCKHGNINQTSVSVPIEILHIPKKRERSIKDKVSVPIK